MQLLCLASFTHVFSCRQLHFLLSVKHGILLPALSHAAFCPASVPLPAFAPADLDAVSASSVLVNKRWPGISGREVKAIAIRVATGIKSFVDTYKNSHTAPSRYLIPAVPVAPAAAVVVLDDDLPGAIQMVSSQRPLTVSARADLPVPLPQPVLAAIDVAPVAPVTPVTPVRVEKPLVAPGAPARNRSRSNLLHRAARMRTRTPPPTVIVPATPEPVPMEMEEEEEVPGTPEPEDPLLTLLDAAKRKREDSPTF